MGSQTRATKTVNLSEVEDAISSVINTVRQDNTRVLIEENGIPVAAVISGADLERFIHYERQRAERFKVLDEIREAFKDVPAEEIERETDRIVAELRGKTITSQEPEQEPEDLWTIVDRMRDAFKDVPDEEIERETDRITARIRAENRAAREALVKSG